MSSMKYTNSAPTSISLVKKTQGEILKIGPLTLRIQEDGSTDGINNRIGAVTISIPPRTPGPPQHWHEMHDETFLVTKGRVRFTTDETDVDTEEGDYMVVPPRSNHTFGNPFDEPAELFCTLSPSFYVEYFRTLARAFEDEGGKVGREEYLGYMARFATLPVE